MKIIKEEEFPINEKSVNKFIEKNKKVWSKTDCNNTYIYVNLSMVRMQVAWIVPKLIYAKGLQKSTESQIIAITWKKNNLLRDFFASYGINHLSLESLNRKNIKALIKALLITLKSIIFNSTGEDLQKLIICDTTAGRSIYEDILRTSNLSTIKSIRNRLCVKKMIHILWTVYSLNDYLRKNKPLIEVSDDIAYHEGLIIKTFLKNGSKSYLSSNWEERPIMLCDDGNIQTQKDYIRNIISENLDKVSDSAWEWTQEYLEERFNGKNGREIDRGAFVGKKVIDRDAVSSELGLNKNKKNIVIMAHTFSDAVFNFGTLYFRDYYDWLEKTLLIASSNSDVNWILKPHPTRKAYNESIDSIEDMYKRCANDNIYFLPDEISAESIKSIADVIVTIGSNAGAEFSCFGIPTIIVGKSYYCGFGYTIEPVNIDEYKNCLLKVQNIDKLSEEQIMTARKVFCLANNNEYASMFFKYNDDFANFVNNNYMKMVDKMALQYFASNEGTLDYNSEILEKILSYMDKHDIRDCQYYMQGVKTGKLVISE